MSGSYRSLPIMVASSTGKRHDTGGAALMNANPASAKGRWKEQGEVRDQHLSGERSRAWGAVLVADADTTRPLGIKRGAQVGLVGDFVAWLSQEHLRASFPGTELSQCDVRGGRHATNRTIACSRRNAATSRSIAGELDEPDGAAACRQEPSTRSPIRAANIRLPLRNRTDCFRPQWSCVRQMSLNSVSHFAHQS